MRAFIERASLIEFEVDYNRLGSIKEAFDKKRHSALGLRIRVLLGIAERAGHVTNLNKSTFKNMKYVRRTFNSGEEMVDLLRA